ALSSIANEPIETTCAGRTDSGVHATHQVIHFDTKAERSEHGWLMGTNTKLPNDIAIHWVKVVNEDFHARFSALYRRYRYVILNRKARAGLLHKRVTWVQQHLDEALMHQAAQALIGEQDFSSFRAAGCQAAHACRNVQAVSVHRQGEFVYIDVQANAFLYHMVRNIAGSLIKIGTGEQPVTWLNTLLAAKDRRQAAPTAPASGLYFVQVAYPESFGLDTTPVIPTFA
ncbi:MAG TPA: tRNA pseudouridine(38-40) synthase TruA, partial [Thiothrix sp.]|nr:tRNA pseudouridine(38-40) synthase TruA [Thiothrix sp.]